MVLLLLTPVLYQHLQRYNELDLPASLSNSLNDLQSPLDSQRTISHESLVSLIKWQRTSPSTTQSKSKSKGKKKSNKAAVSSLPALEDTTLAYLLSLTEPYAPPLPPRERSPALIKILAQLELEADRRTYTAMTALSPLSLTSSFLPSSSTTSISRLSLRDDHATSYNEAGEVKSETEVWDEVGKEITAILNVGASMLAMAVAVWWVGGGRSIALRLGLSMTASVLIGSAETFLYYRSFTRKATAMEARKKMKASKILRLERERLEYENEVKKLQ